MTVLTFNRGLSSAVSKEMLLELTEVRNSLPKNTPWDSDIATRFERIARIAKTAQLRSLQKVLVALARGAHELHKNPTEKLSEVVQKGLHSILLHLQELVQDHKNTPMKMAKPLQSLLTELGDKVSTTIAAELYLPYIPENTAPARPTELSATEFITAIKEYKTVYRQSLVKLIKDNDLTQLASMRQALLTLEPKNPHVGYRVFFEAAIAVFDRLIKTAQLDNIGKWIVGKIDPELDRLTSGFTHVDEDLLSVMLYVVAKAEPESGARMRILQEHFNLKSYLADGADSTVVDKFLTVLVKAREIWTQNNNQDIANMAKLVNELNSKAAILKNPGFAHVINALHEVLLTVQNNELSIPDEQLALEGASALLVLEKQLIEGPSMDTAHMAAARLYALIGKQVETTASDNQTAAIILHRLAAEVQEDLDQLEPKILEIFSGHVEAEDEFRAGLKKVAKILRILGKDNTLSIVIDKFESDFQIPEGSDEKASLATKYTQLGGLVDHLKNSEKTAFAAAQKWLDNLIVKDNTISQEVSIEDDLIDKSNDPEMLEIFLEEAESILIDLEKWQHTLKQDLSDHETLINIRRAYHTLKGSGRMVGLSRFGDLAYITELLLNSFIQTKKIPTKELLAFIVESTIRVTKHIDDFKSPVHTSKVFFDDLEEKALALGGTALADAPQTKKLTQKLNKSAHKAPTSAPTKQVQPVKEAVVIEEPTLTLEAPVVIEEPALTLEAPVVIEEPALTLEAPVVIEEPALILEAPVVIEEPALTFEAPVVIEEPALTFEAPVVVEEPALTFEAPVVVEEPALTFEAPVVVEEPALTFEAPVVVEEPALTFEAPIIENIPETNVDFDLPTTITVQEEKSVIPTLPNMVDLKLPEPVKTIEPIEIVQPITIEAKPVLDVSVKTEEPVKATEAPVRRKHRETPDAWKQHNKHAKVEPVIKPNAVEVQHVEQIAVETPISTPKQEGFMNKLMNWIKNLLGKKS